MWRQLHSWFNPASTSRRSKSPKRGRFQPRLEIFEARLALTVGVFNEDFSDDSNTSVPGFDSTAGGLLIVNDLPSYAPALEGPTGRAGYYYLQNGHPGDPGWGLHADGHVLGIVSSNFGVAQVEFSVPAPGSPGGPAVDEEVTGIGLSIQGYGRVIIVGEIGRIDVTVNGLTWQRIAGDRDDLLPSGVELGTIVRMYVFSYEFVAIDNVTVQVGRDNPNDPPTPVDDFILVDREFGQSEIFDPLANDFDVDGDELQFVFFAQPTRGAVTRVDDQFGNYRGLTYRADADALADPTFREDSFTYIIDDAVNATATGTVRLLLNTQPSAAIDEYDVPHGMTGPLHIDAADGILDNDFDRDGDSLTITAHGQPRHGTVSVTPEGGFHYTPTTPDGLVLPDSFTYTISDGYFQAHSFVSIRVPNEVPIVRSDFLVVEHGLYAIDAFDVTANDPGDPEGDPVGPPRIVAAPLHGTLSVRADGRLRYVPTGDHVYSDTFTYRVADPYAEVYGESNLATVRILVPNQAPVARDDAYRVAPDTTLVVSEAGGVLQNDSDPEDDFLIRATLTKQPGYGTVTLSDDGSFTYVPDDYFEGTDTFGYVAEDGIAQSHAATVTIVSTTGAPLARDDVYVIDPDSEPVELNFLENDWDPDGRPLIFAIPEFPDHGNLISGPNNTMLYEPLPGYEGFDSFEYLISNGIAASRRATVLLQITDDPNVPDTNFDHYSLLHDTWLYEPPYGLLANDPSLPGQSTLVMLEQPPRFGTLSELDLNDDGGFIYTPNPGFVGFDSFQYSVAITNELYASEAQTVSITVRNQDPVARDDFYPIARDSFVWANVLINDADADAETMTAELLTQPSSGIAILEPDGDLYFQPEPGWAGLQRFAYRVFDGAGYSQVAEISVGSYYENRAYLMTPNRQIVVVESTPGTRLNASVSATPPQNTLPDVDVEFPLGFFSFSIYDLPADGRADVRLSVVGNNPPAINQYWKYGAEVRNPQDHWYEFIRLVDTGPEFSPGEILLHFMDGGRGDSDLTANGVIVDPGGPAFRLLPPTVASIVVNDGHVQRSMVNSLTVTFSEEVTLDPGAFELRKGTGRLIGLSVSQSVVNGNTVAVLTFSGRGIIGGSLADGQYTLTVHADRIHSRFGPVLDGDRDGLAGGDAHAEFFRRFGDTDGDGDLDKHDRKLFKNAWRSQLGDANYLWYLDYDLDGDVDKRDWKVFQESRKRCR